MFSPKQPPKNNTPENLKGKEALSSGEGPSKKGVLQEEVEEFLRLIRKSDNKMVDQLNHTPSKISILSLLLSSKDHRGAILKVLNEEHITHNISINQFNEVVANITASSCLEFSNDELPPEGQAHNKALHTSVKCQDNLLTIY